MPLWSRVGVMLGSIRTRLTLSHLAVIIVAMGLSGFLLLSLLEQYFLQATEQSLLAQARITAQALLPGAAPEASAAGAASAAWNTIQNSTGAFELRTENVGSGSEGEVLADVDLSYLADASLQLSAQLQTRIRIVDAGGAVRVDSWQAGGAPGILSGQVGELGSDPLVIQALGGQEAVGIDRTSDDSEPTMNVATPLSIDGRLAGVVYLSQPLRDVTVVLSDLRMRWLVATGIALGLSAAMGLALSGAITRPLRRLTAAAGSVAQGDLDPHVPADAKGELGHLGRAFNNMTARLRAARQMQVDFVANVSHELRTPLTSIKGLVETLRDGAVDDVEVRDSFLETVDLQTDRLIRLVNDLLTLSRADSQALNLERQEFDIAQLAQCALEQMGPQAADRSVTLVLESPAPCPDVWADRDRAEQMLLNLLDNAIKYSRPGGKVTVSIHPQRAESASPGLVEVLVRDEGVGIRAADLDRVGERFYRTDRARSRAEGGSGLGLAIARALVEAHGGRLRLESEEGVGTVVRFSLPCR